MPIPLGILAAAGRSQAPSGAFQLLESTVLTGSQAAVEFTNLTTKYAATYQHLQIRYVARSSYNGAREAVFMRLNGVSTSSYTRHRLQGNGSTVTGSGESSAQTFITGIGSLAGNTETANAFASGVIDILDPFETTKNTTVRSLSGQSATDSAIVLSSGAFLATDSVTAINLRSETAANLVQFSRFSLYGIKATA